MKVNFQKLEEAGSAFRPNGLTIFAGQQNDVYRFLVAGMLSEHIDNPSGVRTLMIRRDMDPAEAFQYAKESGLTDSDVIVIESLATTQMLKLVLTLLKSRLRVWAGVEGLSTQGALDFLRMLVCSQSFGRSQSFEDEWDRFIAAHGCYEVRDCSVSRPPAPMNSSQLPV